MIRELEQTVRSLAEQMRMLSHNSVAPSRTSPSGAGGQNQGTLSQLLRQQTLPPPVAQPPFVGPPVAPPAPPAAVFQPQAQAPLAAVGKRTRRTPVRGYDAMVAEQQRLARGA